jgi:hypothetical protein
MEKKGNKGLYWYSGTYNGTTAGQGYVEVGWDSHAKISPSGSEPVAAYHALGYGQSE